MIISLDIVPELILYAIIFGAIYWLLYKRYIYSLADPLFIFVFTTAFGSVLVVEVIEDSRHIANYFLCQFSLFIGFSTIQIWTGNPARNNKVIDYSFYDDTSFLRYVLYTLFLIYLASNITILYTKGFALLSDNPSTTKETNFRGGFGIFRKVGWAVGGITITGLVFLCLKESRRQDIVLLLVMMLFTSLEGSKGALVKYVICFGQFIAHPAFINQQQLIQRIRRFTPVALAGVFGVFFTVLIKENASNDEVLIAFIRRLLYGADSMLYFYHPVNVQYFSQFSAIDFFSYLINPILGFLRIAPYQEAFGNLMVDNAMPRGVTLDVIVGPNTSFYTEGQVFFGYYGAFVYSFIIGALYSWIRSLFFTLTHSSLFFFIFFSTFVQFSVGLFTDVKTTISAVFDLVALVIPVYIIVCLVVKGTFVIHRVYFNFVRA